MKVVNERHSGTRGKTSSNGFCNQQDDKEDESVRVNVLITCLGIKGAKIYDSLVFTDQADQLTIKSVLDLFDGHFRPQKAKTLNGFNLCLIDNWQTTLLIDFFSI